MVRTGLKASRSLNGDAAVLLEHKGALLAVCFPRDTMYITWPRPRFGNEAKGSMFSSEDKHPIKPNLFSCRPTWAVFFLTARLLSSTAASRASDQFSRSTRESGPPPPATWDKAEDPTPGPGASSNDGPWVVRAYFTDKQMVHDLAAWREPWEVRPEEGYLVLDVTRTEYERLTAAGFRLEIDARLTAQLNTFNAPLATQVSGIPGYPCYRTVEETFATAEAVVVDHPALASWSDIGDSWEKTTAGGAPGYDMQVLRLTNSAVPGPKPKLFAMAAIHAREYATAELLTRFAEFLVNNHAVNPDVTWLLDYQEIHLLLQANPDGRKQAEAQILWRKNTNNDHCTDTPFRGVDLNRNFGFQWGCCGGSSAEECSEIYRGPAAASEPETQAIQDYVRAQFPDQREDDLSAAAPITATGVFLDIHSYGELVLWPWGTSDSPAPNGTALQTLGRKLAFFNDHIPQQAVQLYPADGTSDALGYGELGLASYTFEVGPRSEDPFFHGCATFENSILPNNLPALIYAAKVARTPYLTPSGPDALDFILTPGTVVVGGMGQLSATIDDTRYNHINGVEPTQQVVAAEYYVDAPPWITDTTPVARELVAADGVFDEEIEVVQGDVDTSGLSLGRHTIFVRGQDADGQWGPFSAVFLHVSASQDSFYLPIVISNRES
jgi:carboxypeptidase T